MDYCQLQNDELMVDNVSAAGRAGMLRHKCLGQAVIISLCLLLSATATLWAGDLPGPREPLTFHDMGLYGGWNDYWLSDECPFNFFIVQAWVRPEGGTVAHGMSEESTWGQWLRRANEKGKRIVAVVTPLDSGEAKDPLAHFQAALDSFLQGVDESLLYGITLDEENVFWDGHAERLCELYRYVKENYNVPVYQWWSPYASPPGFGWPHLPADGWLIDEYARGGVSFEHFVRSYVVHQLPVIQIVWAAPLMADFNWERSGDSAFDWQLRVCRKYGIPCGFFMWEGHGNVWGWSPDALPASKAVHERAVQWTHRAAASQLEPYKAIWDDLPSLQPQTLVCTESGNLSFEEDFLSSGGLVAAGAAIKGFRDLRWDGGPLELRPRQPGPASATLLYPLHCDFPTKRLRITVTGRVEPSLAGCIELSASADGDNWTPAQAMAGQGKVTIDLSGYARFKLSREVWVRVVLSGRSKRVDDVPAAVETITVNGQLVPPSEKAIRLPVVPGLPVQWQTGFEGATMLLTAHVDNREHLEIGNGFVGTHGTDGYVNTVILRQRFVADKGIDLNRITSTNYADEQNFAATNFLGGSLDGRNVLVEQTTSGAAQGTELVLDLSTNEQFRDVQEFWVHLTMTSACGVKTGTTNSITGLAIEGIGAKLHEGPN